MLKPHRVVMDKVSGYADEAAAYVRRRRHHRRSFARIQYQSGISRHVDLDSVVGRQIADAARELIESDPGSHPSAPG